jgi:hypothetical protein
MRVIKFLSVLIIALSSLKADIVNDYLNKKYKEICSFNTIKKYKSNEKALSIIGVSCIKTDNIYLLSYIINQLKHTNYGRKNSIYFLTVLMEKKLLYSYLFDGLSLEAFSFPMTDYVLSYIFDAVKCGKYKKVGDLIVIKNEDENTTYHLYKKSDKMYVDEYKNGKLIKRRWYR